MENVKEINRGGRKVRIDGVVYELKKPTVLQVREFRLKSAKDEDNGELLTIELLADCGIDKDVVETLDLDSISTLMGEILPKKNK